MRISFCWLYFTLVKKQKQNKHLAAYDPCFSQTKYMDREDSGHLSHVVLKNTSVEQFFLFCCPRWPKNIYFLKCVRVCVCVYIL